MTLRLRINKILKSDICVSLFKFWGWPDNRIVSTIQTVYPISPFLLVVVLYEVVIIIMIVMITIIILIIIIIRHKSVKTISRKVWVRWRKIKAIFKNNYRLKTEYRNISQYKLRRNSELYSKKYNHINTKENIHSLWLHEKNGRQQIGQKNVGVSRRKHKGRR